MPFLRQCFLLLAAAASVLSSEDIDIKCSDHSVTVTWRVNKELAKIPSRLFLGSCFPSKFVPTADGGGEAVFYYRLSECQFRQKRHRNKLVYENELTFRPLPKRPAAFSYPVVCTSKRPDWIRPLTNNGVQVLQGHGRLIFHMGLLKDDLSGPAPSYYIPLGSFIHIWAAVEQQAHQPLVLYLEECVASTSPTLEPESPKYPVITNKGCLVDSKVGYSRFLPRYHSSSVLLQLQAFSFALEQEVYLHCKLVVWDPDDLTEEKKACHYNKDLGGWELLDDPLRNDLCACCDYSCSRRAKRGLSSEFRGLAQSVVLGPLIITARNDKLLQESPNR